ncbi:Cof-type HAD-IIB family hydrolase [Clostridium bornimense]|uniref:Cof-type HAD-IIB family hydrolase n=1 Tax=Clostridium bornimense TaxID=1216932 RepID=UPI001C0F5C8F|nr:Cof-type HAD-IIB family hydrolase [Clostridium bornimense]MBU5317635.1 Cof-type HAD-IIB family hydrolase [Clostridium bornimense]
MDKKIVFFDIDGTLIDEETHLIPNSTKEALKNLKANGNLAFINTGRPIFEITDYIRSFDFDGYICGCGTYIEFNNEVLFYKSLGNKLSLELAKDIKLFNLEGILEGRYDIYFDKIENIKNSNVLRIMEQHKREGFFTGSTLDDQSMDVDKLVIFCNESSNFLGFYNKYKNVFDFIKRSDNFYELVPNGYSKASGIKFIIDYLNIPLENTYAIGDSTNDLSMLQYVENSIAMGNSNPEIFDLVSYKTTSVNDNGIYNALKHYNLI